MNLKEKYIELRKNNSAIIAANFYNLETLKGLLIAANEQNSSVILQLSKSSIDYMGLKTSVAMAKAALEEYNVQGWLHLDHGNSYELVRNCLDAGFDSVMIDGSELSFDENVVLTCRVVEAAKKYNVPVEAELGFIAKLGQDHDKGDKFTKTEEARLFVEQTKVDALAIAIGTAHGFYKETPKLDFGRLKEIKSVLPNTALVLHGSSGIPHEDIERAIALGISKINVATEFKDIFMKSLKEILNSTDNIDIRQTFPGAIRKVTELAKTKLNLTKQKEL
ncbi:MAG: class II fructose-bisphosphate aldolase [Ignavibacteriae bacterium]|nr:class II fructose-bisphosphate aldolase [Ignavibacteriota bacterium]MCB9075915.1 class II fructose-bisphosphate aldolase [Chitinophagales bacterium]MCB9247728.1 class II fructose-bisphosphate aldolase [Ignavibacteriales bacterium]MCB0742261.1 class II fructose-bisphosphate aldolase [Ignavibacteriota bacterium]MCB0745845.1 class II fructose-bisphosphate aldolase [Ignavibacteriota bacterium]